jgi:hypothetical protein
MNILNWINILLDGATDTRLETRGPIVVLCLLLGLFAHIAGSLLVPVLPFIAAVCVLASKSLLALFFVGIFSNTRSLFSSYGNHSFNLTRIPYAFLILVYGTIKCYEIVIDVLNETSLVVYLHKAWIKFQLRSINRFLNSRKMFAKFTSQEQERFSASDAGKEFVCMISHALIDVPVNISLTNTPVWVDLQNMVNYISNGRGVANHPHKPDFKIDLYYIKDRLLKHNDKARAFRRAGQVAMTHFLRKPSAKSSELRSAARISQVCVQHRPLAENRPVC